MAQKPYSPVAAYDDLKRVETALQQAQTADEVRKVCAADGPKIDYKAFCYLLTGRLTAEAMKPDEACAVAVTLEQAGQTADAQAIYQRVLKVHSDHPVARSRMG